MSNTGPVIRVFSIGEDWVFSFRFLNSSGAAVAMNGSGVGYKIRFIDKKTHAVKSQVLDTSASGTLALAIGGAGNNEITGQLAKATTTAWGKGRFSADLIRYTSTTEKRIVPVIVSQVEDGDTDITHSDGIIGAIVDASTFDLNGPAYIIYDGPKGDAWGSTPMAWVTGLVCVAAPVATVVTYLGACYRCNNSHTAGASFDAAKFDLIVPSADVTPAALAAQAGAETARDGAEAAKNAADADAIATAADRVQTGLDRAAAAGSATASASSAASAVTAQTASESARDLTLGYKNSVETYAATAAADRAAIVAMGSVPAAPYLLDGLPPAAIISAPRDAYMLNGAYVPLSSLLTFSSAQKYTIGADGKYKLNAGNGPAYEWSDGRSRLLIEANPSTNYWLNSEDAALWPNATGYTAASTPNALGAIAVHTLTATAVNVQASAFSVTMTAGSYLTERFLIKSNMSSGDILVAFYGTTSGFGAGVDTVVRVLSGPATAAEVPVTPGMYKLSGVSATVWSEIEITRHVLVAETMLHEMYAQGVTIGQTLTLARCQVEKAEYSSSYIPCGAAPTARAADIVRLTDPLKTILNSSASTLVVRGTTNNGHAIYGVILGSTLSGGLFFTDAVNGAAVWNSGQAAAVAPPYPVASRDFGFILAAGKNGRRVALNGGAVAADTNASQWNAESYFSVGSCSTNQTPMNMLLDEIVIWPFFASAAGIQPQARVYP